MNKGKKTQEEKITNKKSTHWEKYGQIYQFVLIVITFLGNIYNYYLSTNTAKVNKNNWESINNGNLIVSKIEMNFFKKMPIDEYFNDSTKYSDVISYTYDDPILGDDSVKVHLIEKIIAKDTKTNVIIRFPYTFYSIKDMNEYMIKNKMDYKSVYPLKESIYMITIKNKGYTNVKNAIAKVTFQDFKYSNTFKLKDLEGTEEQTVYVEYYKNLSTKIAGEYNFKVELNWEDINSELHTKTINIKQHTDREAFEYNNY